MGSKVALPYVGMVMAECAQVGLMILSKAAMSNGMSCLIFILYSNALASLVLLPSSLLFHRTGRPPLTVSVVFGLFLLGLVGFLAQVFGYVGINLSSPTLCTAMLNLVPGFIFLLAIAFRMEKLNLKTYSAMAKSMGTVVSIAGAFIITFYKGPQILKTYSGANKLDQLLMQQSNWVIGGLFLAIDCVMASLWIIVQALILRRYPAELIIVFFYCFFVTIQCAIACLIVEKDATAWRLNSNIRIFAVLYSGIFGSVFQVGITTWCLHKTGPVFVAMFKPLGIAIAAAAGVIFFGDAFYLGSLVGAIVIVAGFYTVMWGKAKEKVVADTLRSTAGSSGQNVPLLQSCGEQTESLRA